MILKVKPLAKHIKKKIQVDIKRASDSDALLSVIYLMYIIQQLQRGSRSSYRTYCQYHRILRIPIDQR